MSENDTLNQPAFVPPTPTELNEQFENQIQFLELVGQGGMGAVYRAFHPTLRQYVAVKIISSRKSSQNGWDFVERFKREARALALLDSPYIVKLHDFDEKGQYLYFAMEFVDGSDLHTLIQQGKLTTEHAQSWIPQVCLALECAHLNGLIHRDVKPGNILVDELGMVKLTDFGLVKRQASKGRVGLTQASISIGTPNYLAPEAMESGAEVDHRADIYSLGVVLYQMLTGKLPLGAWHAPSSLIPGLDPRFDAVVIKALQQDREDRYERVSEFGDAILEISKASLQQPPRHSQKKGRLLLPQPKGNLHSTRRVEPVALGTGMTS